MAVKQLSITDLERELSRRQNALGSLETKHASLLKQLKDVESEMSAIRGTGAKRGPGRPRGSVVANKRGKAAKASTGTGRRGRGKNALTLPDAIVAVMDKGAVVSPKEAASLVKKSGYKTKSKTFGIQVATTLAKDNRFKRLGRGQYKRVK